MKYTLNREIQIEVFEDNEMVIVDVTNEKTHILNGTAALIVQMHSGKSCSEEDCISSFMEQVDVPVELRTDACDAIKCLLKQLIDEGVLSNEKARQEHPSTCMEFNLY